MIIKNYRQLCKTELRKNALDILLAGIESVVPQNFMKKNIRFENGFLYVCNNKFTLRGKLYVIGGGKASGTMAEALEKIIPKQKITGGIVNAKTVARTSRINVNIASHPLPDRRGLIGVQKMLEMTSNPKKEDIVICLISGGGSALMPDPADGITLEELQKMTQIMIKCGAETYELNMLRKHTSKLKGGNLARLLQPATVISFILSDVVNPNDVTASGPTEPDKTTFQQCYEVLEKYNLKKIPKSIVLHIKKGIRGKVPETVKPNEKFMKNVYNYVLADKNIALRAMGKKTVELGFKTEVLRSIIRGDVRTAAQKTAALLKKKYKNEDGAFALVYSSENTVIVKGKGKGGRNQEYVACLINEIKDFGNCVIASSDSDGVDYLEGVGGAIADSYSYNELKRLELDINKFLISNNTFELHKRLGNLIFMNPTDTNVGDLNVCLMLKS